MKKIIFFFLISFFLSGCVKNYISNTDKLKLLKNNKTDFFKVMDDNKKLEYSYNYKNRLKTLPGIDYTIVILTKENSKITFLQKQNLFFSRNSILKTLVYIFAISCTCFFMFLFGAIFASKEEERTGLLMLLNKPVISSLSFGIIIFLIFLLFSRTPKIEVEYDLITYDSIIKIGRRKYSNNDNQLLYLKLNKKKQYWAIKNKKRELITLSLYDDFQHIQVFWNLVSSLKIKEKNN